MMIVYKVNIPIFKDDKIVDNEVREYTKEDILNEYWKFWSSAMERKYGVDHSLITENNCIEDWIVVNWAWKAEKHEAKNDI